MKHPSGEDPFAEPKKVLRWAHRQFDKLVETGKAFLEAKQYSFVKDVDPVTNHILVKLVFHQPVPDDIEEGAYRVLGDLRNALDQACHAACMALASADPDRTNFPMTGTLNELQRQLAAPKGPYRGIPAELHPKLIEFAPFWPGPDGGDKLLRALGDMANPNKHRAPVQAGIDPREIGIHKMRGLDLRSVFQWNAAKTELTAFLLVPNGREPPSYNINLKVRYAFAKGPLEGEPVTDTLRAMFALVERILAELQAETERLRSAG